MIKYFFKIHKKKTIFLLSLILSFSILWIKGGEWFATKFDDDISPNGYYRLEFWLHPIDSGEGYVYLYDNQTNKLLAKSQKYYMDGNSFIYWRNELYGKTGIKVGIDVFFITTPEPDEPCCSANHIVPLKAELYDWEE